MATVRKIPQQVMMPPKLKVAAYCRVSTNDSAQLASLAVQEQYYEDRIRSNSSWEFASIYSDIGTGTKAKGRKQFNAIISACRRGKIDVVLTKSAHRFARNTVDALETIRLLRHWNVDIYFEQENLHTLHESSEFMMTLICARAQNESESKSADIVWGLQKAFQNPDSGYYQRKCYGYTHDEDGNLIVNKAEAKVVRLIYQLAAERTSLSQISLRLKNIGIPSPRGKVSWPRETLKKILQNEKYKGNVTLQKTFVVNCLEHKQIKNRGQMESFQIKGNHEPIMFDEE